MMKVVNVRRLGSDGEVGGHAIQQHESAKGRK